MLGTVFGFVASDVKVKVEILQAYRKGPNKDKYESVRGMLLYETESGYLKDNKTGNASRTFLRLHRALCKYIKQNYGEFCKGFKQLETDFYKSPSLVNNLSVLSPLQCSCPNS